MTQLEEHESQAGSPLIHPKKWQKYIQRSSQVVADIKLEDVRTLQLKVTLQRCCSPRLSTEIERKSYVEWRCWWENHRTDVERNKKKYLAFGSQPWQLLIHCLQMICPLKPFPSLFDAGGYPFSPKISFDHSKARAQPSSPPDQRPECRVSEHRRFRNGVSATTVLFMVFLCHLCHLDVSFFSV
jgi:hypothetical protein